MSVTKEKWKVFFINFGIKSLFLIIIFAPISILILFNYNWQIVAIGLVASALFSFICGINKFQTFKIGKDGVEVKKAVEEAKDVLGEINRVVKDYVLLSLLNANKIGIKSDEIIESVDEADKYSIIIQERNISDEEVSKQLKKFKSNILLKIIEIVNFRMDEINLIPMGSEKPNKDIIIEAIQEKELISPQDLTNVVREFEGFYKEYTDAGKDGPNSKEHYKTIDEFVDYYLRYYDILVD
ncbi:hypothetical protein HCB00_08485 [Listeria innocua]|uniref:hypothetical protein n=1 Tax=Listeria innocua TaxID=1642 RepID=UPI001625AA3C|nr:hypothetical protein [Listeria innocua]MBC2151554.1 hypothetical protein [Listeria innocua]